jgi:hypothetical protein
VDQLLAVGGVVALVRVVADEPALVQHQEGLPHGGEAVVGDGLAARGDVRDEGPGVAFVGAGVELDLRGREVRGDGAAGEKDGARGPFAEFLGEDVEEGLVAEAVLGLGLVVDTRYLGGMLDGGWAIELCRMYVPRSSCSRHRCSCRWGSTPWTQAWSPRGCSSPMLQADYRSRTQQCERTECEGRCSPREA